MHPPHPLPQPTKSTISWPLPIHQKAISSKISSVRLCAFAPLRERIDGIRSLFPSKAPPSPSPPPNLLPIPSYSPHQKDPRLSSATLTNTSLTTLQVIWPSTRIVSGMFIQHSALRASCLDDQRSSGIHCLAIHVHSTATRTSSH